MTRNVLFPGRRMELLFLEASKQGVDLPDGYFGLAKMLHSLQSQAGELDLGNVVEDTIRDIYIQRYGIFGAFFKTRG